MINSADYAKNPIYSPVSYSTTALNSTEGNTQSLLPKTDYASTMPLRTNPIAPQKNRTVTIDGKTYKVVTVPYNDPLRQTFAPEYRDVIIVDGKQYPVEEVSSMIGCDMTKEVVVVDGKQYNVNGNNLMQDAINGLGNILKETAMNNNGKLDYMA